MVGLDEYKKRLIDYYYYECDNNIEKRKLREQNLNKEYGDEYLNKIIEDTYNFIKKIFDEIENSYFRIPLDEDITSYISLNLIGGYSSDTLFTDCSGSIISRYILQRTFGSRLTVEVHTDEYEKYDDPDIVSFDYKYSLYLQGFPENMEGIRKRLFGKNKVKMR